MHIVKHRRVLWVACILADGARQISAFQACMSAVHLQYDICLQSGLQESNTVPVDQYRCPIVKVPRHKHQTLALCPLNMRNATALQITVWSYSACYLKDALYANMASNLVYGKLLSAFHLLAAVLAA